MNPRRALGLLLLALLAWRALAGGVKLVQELGRLTPELLARAVAASEEERIEHTLRFYETVPEGPIDMVGLWRAIEDHTPRDARIFAVAGDHERFPKALVNLQSFFWPRRIHVAPRSPERESWRRREGFYVLTLAGPYARDPEGVLEPLVATEAWTLWR